MILYFLLIIRTPTKSIVGGALNDFKYHKLLIFCIELLQNKDSQFIERFLKFVFISQKKINCLHDYLAWNLIASLFFRIKKSEDIERNEKAILLAWEAKVK